MAELEELINARFHED